MAQSYQCDICKQVAGDFMVTALADGQSQVIGIECLAEWAIALTEAWSAAVAAEQGRIDAAVGPAEVPGVGWEYEDPEPAPKSRQRAQKATPVKVDASSPEGSATDGAE